MVKARRLSAKVLDMMSKANKKQAFVEERLIKEHSLASDWLHQERTHHSRESARLKQKQLQRLTSYTKIKSHQ
jgi:hypothetical protein